MKILLNIIVCILLLLSDNTANGEEVTKLDTFNVREPAFGYPGFSLVGNGSFLSLFGGGHSKKMFVTNISVGFAAEEAGLEAGDELIGVDGIHPSEWSSKELLTYLTSRAGKILTIKIRRSPDGNEISVPIKMHRWTKKEFAARQETIAYNYWGIVVRNIYPSKWTISNNFMEKQRRNLAVYCNPPSKNTHGFRLEKFDSGEIALRELISGAPAKFKVLTKGDVIVLGSDGSYRIEYLSERSEPSSSPPVAPDIVEKSN